MAENKKSFLLYCDIIHTIEKLTDEQAGKLLKHTLKYVNDLNPTPEDIITEIAFEPIKQSLKRDLLKYEGIRVKNKDNANKRWADKNNATASERIPSDTKNADSDSDSDSDIVKDIINWAELLKFFNTKTKKNCKVIPTKAKTTFTARLKEGYSKQDFATAIQNCAADEFHINNPHHLTLEFISRQDKLDKYLNVGDKPKNSEKQNPKNLRVVI
jgi:uncharacterized phage protein (TIGR02220 family)